MARYVALPLFLISLLFLLHGSTVSPWAIHGFQAGIIGVVYYDFIRIPFVLTHVWADFIPKLGGLIIGNSPSNVFLGYIWRWVGDGGGIALSFFMACHLINSSRFFWILHYPIGLAVAYGVFIWSGLMATVTLTRMGHRILFELTPLSFTLSLIGHLVYGIGVGLYLRSFMLSVSSGGRR
ncbi:hypothetical protein [Streptomyces sp. 1222.5]|uniref:hypothetical protein n=1 Tax=Streptomyces sp. 1222.5 TaxID=1881026 RepID=UPI003EB6A8E3